MTDCIHHLERAIAIQNERHPARRLQLLRDLPAEARDPVLAWLWAHATRPQTGDHDELRDAMAKARA